MDWATTFFAPGGEFACRMQTKLYIFHRAQALNAQPPVHCRHWQFPVPGKLIPRSAFLSLRRNDFGCTWTAKTQTDTWWNPNPDARPDACTLRQPGKSVPTPLTRK